MPALDFEEMAEKLIKVEVVAFTRAWQNAAFDLTRKGGFLLARGTLKKAIIDALKIAASDKERNDAKAKR